MQAWTSLLTLAGMHLLLAMIPGPNTVVVSWLSATVSRRDGLLATAGIVLASLIWVVLSLWGVGALLLQAGWLYHLLRLAGAAYLLHIGIRMLRSGLRPTPTGPTPTGAAAPPRLFGQNPFRAGLVTTLSNPKSAVCWTSAFLVAVPPHPDAWLYPAIVAVIGLQSGLWYGLVALVFSTGMARQHYLRLARRLDLLAGGVMIALGLRLADDVRRELVLITAR